jgi:hypothetical protein
MMNDIEILMYALGASFPVLSRYMIQMADPGPGHTHSNFSSWARYIPDFFVSSAQQVQSRITRREVVDSQITHHTTTRTIDQLRGEDGTEGRGITVSPCESDGSQTSSEASDLEKAIDGTTIKTPGAAREGWN